MRVRIQSGKANGTVQAPPSKSMAHRYLIAAALAEGKSLITGVEYSQDILATIDCLRALGVEIQCEGDRVCVTGAKDLVPRGELLCRESGSTLRFMVPLCLLSGRPATLMGSERLMERPLTVYETLCSERGFRFERTNGVIHLCGTLQSGRYTLDGSISSQFITGMILALLKCEGESTLQLTGKVESRSYIDMTLSALREFGFAVEWQGESSLLIFGGCGKPRNLAVEGDYSNAAALEALNFLGGEVRVLGLKPDSLQGDRVYSEYFCKLKQGYATLSLANCPDLGPILMAVAAALNGAHLTDTARLKIKESDRGAAMAEELQKCGVSVRLEENDIYVEGGRLKPSNVTFNSHNDHRIVMSMAVLCTLFGGEICGAEAVAKSMPTFFEKLLFLGIEVKIDETE
ncbi:MAG: 3-phosphoshikimate 1-carboxyvinyltransferase [Clostridia bacterium]|nr:3-phosphoshikimate 1-carboxyvinyltransferase [Clostridia bacterium]